MAGNNEQEKLPTTNSPRVWMKGKVIGSGSFGAVHLAINKADGSLFVVKTAESNAGIRSLENEADILEYLNSPHIVRCLGKEVSSPGANGEKKTSLFMEYVAAGNLAEVTEKLGGKLDEEVVRLYTRGILQGLSYLHRNGIVHCDLKCKNVLLGSCGNVKLADFGCAKRLLNASKSDEKHSKLIGGTPLWMAPEVLRNEGFDSSADIWSLGCTVIEMATGKSPWGELEILNPMAAVLRIASGDERPCFPREFSEEGFDFLGKCLERNPNKRWTVEALLDHPFVTGKQLNQKRTIVKEVAFSPTSVFDYVSEEDSPSEMEIMTRIPFSVRCYDKRKKASAERQCMKSEWASSSENWVTVRTG